MVAAADRPIDASKQGCCSTAGRTTPARLHAELEAAGIDVGEIEHPFYMRAGEFEVIDPDGYVVLVGQLDAAAPAAG